MVNSSVEKKSKIQRKSKISAKWPCQAVLIYMRLWFKFFIIELAKLKLFQRQVCTTTMKQEEHYMANYRQQEGDMAIHMGQLYYLVSSQLLLNRILLYRQPVDYMAVFLVIYLAHDFIYIHHHLEAFRSLVFSLTEYRHFQGSWSVPRRSGSQVTNFWLMVASSQLGQTQDTIKEAKDEQKLVENNFGGEDKMKEAQEHSTFFLFWECISSFDGFPTRHVFLKKQAESFPEP